MEPFRLRPVPGSTLDPKHVIGRDATIAAAIAQMRDRINLLLSDPRRMGKTALLDRMCHLPAEGVLAVKVDYEGVNSVEGFMLRTIHALREHQPMRKRVVDAVTPYVELEAGVGVAKVKAAFAHKDPHTVLADVVSAIDKRLGSDELLVIAMDEVPLAVDNIARNPDFDGPYQARRLLQALRLLRGNGAGSIRWVVTGSIGFHHVLRRCEATEGAVNDLVNLPLGPLAESDSADLARCLLLGIGRDHRDEEVVAALVERSGGVPYMLHALAHVLSGMHADATPGLVDDAFDAFVDDRDGSRAITHLSSRITLDYGDRTAAALRVLDALAESGPLADDALCDAHTDLADREAYLALIDDLQDDHYITRTAGRLLQWRYDVFRRIWCRRRSLLS